MVPVNDLWAAVDTMVSPCRDVMKHLGFPEQQPAVPLLEVAATELRMSVERVALLWRVGMTTLKRRFGRELLHARPRTSVESSGLVPEMGGSTFDFGCD